MSETFGKTRCAHNPFVECQHCAMDRRDAELSAMRAKVAELESERLRALKIADALTLDTQSLPEAVDALVEMVRSARRERDAARRDLEAASRFGFVRSDGALVQATMNHNGKTWCVTIDGGIAGEEWLSTTRDAALAEARKLAGEKT